MPDNFVKGDNTCTPVGIQIYSNAILTILVHQLAFRYIAMLFWQKIFNVKFLELEKDKDPSYDVDVNKHSESLDKKQSGKKLFYSCTYF